jgi:hypothetical protein
MDTLQNIALAGGLSWASGFRLYATVLITGLLGRFGVVHLPEGLHVLTDNWVLGIAGVLAIGEFLADKIPAFDSVWDAIHTFIRVPAGVLLAWGVFRDSAPSAQFAAALLGGALASGTHLAKTGGRALINTSPEPFSNWGASAGEDISWLGGMYLMWLIPKIVRGLRTLARRLRGTRVSTTGA